MPCSVEHGDSKSIRGEECSPSRRLSHSDYATLIRHLKRYDSTKEGNKRFRDNVDTKEEMAIQETFRPKRQPISNKSRSTTPPSEVTCFGGSIMLKLKQRSSQLNLQGVRRSENGLPTEFERKRNKDQIEEGALYGSIRATEKTSASWRCRNARMEKMEVVGNHSGRELKKKIKKRQVSTRRNHESNCNWDGKNSANKKGKEDFYMPPFVISFPPQSGAEQSRKEKKPSKHKTQSRRSSCPRVQGGLSFDSVPSTGPTLEGAKFSKKKKKGGRRASMPDCVETDKDDIYDWELTSKEQKDRANYPGGNEWKHIQSDANAVRRQPEERIGALEARYKISNTSCLLKLEALLWIVEPRLKE